VRVWHAGVEAGMEASEVAGPAAGMPWPFSRREISVLKSGPGAAAVGGAPDLDGARCGRLTVGARVAPADQQPVRGFEVQVAAPNRGCLDVEVEAAARPGFERYGLRRSRVVSEIVLL
jgi:hypothetical protein